MANLKDIRNRISSVKKTKQITSAMKLVAGAKLKRATDKALAARPYREQLQAVLGRVAANVGDIDEPLLEPRASVKKALVVLLTSDRGLCGPFNNALLRKTWEWMAKKRAEGVELDVRVYGRKGDVFLRRQGVEVVASTVDTARLEKMDMVTPLTSAMVSGFVDGQYDEVYMIYNRFVSALVQTPTFDKVLPLSVDDVVEEGSQESVSLEYRYEPGAPEILGTVLPLFLQTLVLQSFLETEAGEHAARMTAMDSATRNASDLIDRLTLDYNRARQAAITTEIIEITSGAAAL